MRRLMFSLGRWLVARSGLPAEPAGSGGQAYHLDRASLASWDKAAVRSALEKAAEDFEAAGRGLQPIHARQQGAFLDGGTTIWQGDGYSIRLMKAMATVGEVHGLMYGPVMKLDYPLAEGNSTELSRVAFYTHPALQQYLGDPA